MLCGRVILGFYKKMDDKFRSAYGDLQSSDDACYVPYLEKYIMNTFLKMQARICWIHQLLRIKLAESNRY